MSTDEFGRQTRLDEARKVVVLGDLVEAERQIIVEGPTESPAASSVPDWSAWKISPAAMLVTEAARASPRPGRRGRACGSAGPGCRRRRSARLRNQPPAWVPVVARQESLHAELVVDLVPHFLAAEKATQAVSSREVMPNGTAGGLRKLFRGGGPWLLFCQLIGGAMAHLGRTLNDRIERLQRRHEFAGRIDLDDQAAAGRPQVMRSAMALRADTEAGKLRVPPPRQVVTMRHV